MEGRPLGKIEEWEVVGLSGEECGTHCWTLKAWEGQRWGGGFDGGSSCDEDGSDTEMWWIPIASTRGWAHKNKRQWTGERFIYFFFFIETSDIRFFYIYWNSVSVDKGDKCTNSLMFKKNRGEFHLWVHGEVRMSGLMGGRISEGLNRDEVENIQKDISGQGTWGERQK